MVAQQQKMGEKKGIVMDGRDIGTVVFPQAELKIFMTAQPHIRAQRRKLELLQKGEDLPLEEIVENLRMRDEMEGIFSHHTGRSVEEIRVDMDRDKILTAHQAKEYGIIDAVISSRKA
jgi:cytidylate kinase